jgi:hypothetical protein
VRGRLQVPKVVLEFVTDGTEEEAWALAEALERGATAKGYRAVNGYVASMGEDRGLVPVGGQVPVISAMTTERVTPGAPVTSVSPEGKRTLEEPAVSLRHFGET